MLHFRRSVLTVVLAFATAASPVLAQTAGTPLTLDEAIQRALARNFDIRVGALGLDIAKGNLLAEWGRYDPVLSASFTHDEDGSPQSADPFSGARPPSSIVESDVVDFSLQGSSPIGFSYRLRANRQNRRGTFNSFADNYFTFAGVELTQPLLRGFGIAANHGNILIARTDRRLSEWDYRQAVMDTITQVIFTYHDLYFAQRNLETSRRSRDLAAGLLAENEIRARVGGLSESDVTEARARVASREEAILVAERTVREQENFLKQLITSDRTPSLLSDVLTIAPPTPLPALTPQPALDFRPALDRRPDYQQALLLVERARVGRNIRRNQLLPRVDLVASYGYNGLDADAGESRRQVEDRESRSYSAGAVVSLPLTWTAERGRYRAAKYTLERAETELEQVEQNVVVRLGNAAGQVETTRKRIEATRIARELAQQNLDGELKKLRAGTGSTFLVLNQQELLSTAETREARALADHQRALAEYDRQLGATLESHRVILAP